MKILYYLLVFIPVGIVLNFMNANPTLIFAVSALSIVGLAALMGKATEDAAFYLGQRVGGFLNATFGNAAELLINIFVLKAGMTEVVKASIVGSVIGNILLVLGLSMFCGGLKQKVQTFNIKAVTLNSTLLFFALIGMVLPTAFAHTMNDGAAVTTEFSVLIAVLFLILYVLELIFTFVTHKAAFQTEEVEEGKADWSLKKSLIILVGVTVFLGIMSEIFTGSVEGMSENLGLNELFVGLIMIPIIGNAAEHSTAIFMAMKNKMDAVIEVSVGSTLQVILFVMPVLVFVSLLFEPLSLTFSMFEIVVLIAAGLITNRVIEDGRSNWFEGVELVMIYGMIAIAYFIV